MSRPLALLSVSDKTGIVDLGRRLVERGFEILSTGGTMATLAEAGVPVTAVSDHTGHREIMGGRVKTLHPRIHGGILGRRATDAAVAAAHDVRFIDLVVVNLYPFEATVTAGPVSIDAAMEQVDIGGPTMVRAAAKNHRDVTVVTDPTDYDTVVAALDAGTLSSALRASLALKAFRHTAAYDGLIAQWLGAQVGGEAFPPEVGLPLRKAQDLRYGENPHQRAALYIDPLGTGRSLGRARQIQGKELSFNNVADLDGALRAVFEFDTPAVVIVKHMNPCGAATAESLSRAFALALSGDPVSAYGGIVAFNRPLDEAAVRAMRQSRVFFEVIGAPSIAPEAKELLALRDNLRVIELPPDWADTRPPGHDARRVQGGWLFQDWDTGHRTEWRTVSKRAPTDSEARLLGFAWTAVQATKSNGIVLATSDDADPVLNGVGAGQMSRVDSVGLAIAKATRPVPGSVLASDAFFPFADGVKRAVDAGVTAIVAPGGSIRDEEVIGVADAAGVAMVFTGARHFRH